MYFDVEEKTWKPLASTTPAIEATHCYCAASAGNNLYVAGFYGGNYVFCYDTRMITKNSRTMERFARLSSYCPKS